MLDHPVTHPLAPFSACFVPCQSVSANTVSLPLLWFVYVASSAPPANTLVWPHVVPDPVISVSCSPPNPSTYCVFTAICDCAGQTWLVGQLVREPLAMRFPSPS